MQSKSHLFSYRGGEPAVLGKRFFNGETVVFHYGDDFVRPLVDDPREDRDAAFRQIPSEVGSETNYDVRDYVDRRDCVSARYRGR